MSRTIATFRLYGGLLWSIVAVLWESIRETWPQDEREGGVFLAGISWAFVIFWTVLIAVTWMYAWSLGMKV